MPKLITPEKLNRIKLYVNEQSAFDCKVYLEQGKCPPHRIIRIADQVEITRAGVRFSFDVRRWHYKFGQELKRRMDDLDRIAEEAIYQVLD